VDITYQIFLNGRAQEKRIILRNVVSIQRLSSQTIITFANGRSKRFPPGATVVQIRAVEFAHPGKPLPPAFVSRRPDYIVP